MTAEGTTTSKHWHHHDATRPVWLPKPLAHPWSLRWLGQGILNLCWSLIAGHVIRWDYIALYFVLTQSNAVRPHWNAFFVLVLGMSVGVVVRHFVRAGFESQFTSATIWAIIANPFLLLRPHRELHGIKKVVHSIFAPSWLLGLLERVGIPTPRTYRDQGLKWWQWLIALPALVISAAPGYALGIGIYFAVTFIGNLFGIHAHYDYSVHTSFGKQEVQPLTTWQYTLSGVLGTVFYSRLVFRVYAIELLRLSARQWAAFYQAAHRQNRYTTVWLIKPRWPLPVGLRAAFTEAVATEQTINWAIVGAFAILALLVIPGAIFGYVVITWVAPGRMKIAGFSSGGSV